MEQPSQLPAEDHTGADIEARLNRSRPAILVNGLPAAGKTTLARALSRRLGLQLISKDVIKESYAQVLGADPPDDRPQREWNGLLGAGASEAMWALLADASSGAVLESTWPAPETCTWVWRGLARARIDRPVQIWCEVPVYLARERFEKRVPDRHPIHGEPPNDDEWSHRWATAAALPIQDTLRVDTTSEVGLEPVVAWLRSIGLPVI